MFKIIGKKIITILHPKSFPFEETIGPSRPEISHLNDRDMLQCAMVVILLSGKTAFGNYECAKLIWISMSPQYLPPSFSLIRLTIWQMVITLGNPGVTHSVPTALNEAGTEWVMPGLPRMDGCMNEIISTLLNLHFFLMSHHQALTHVDPQCLTIKHWPKLTYYESGRGLKIYKMPPPPHPWLPSWTLLGNIFCISENSMSKWCSRKVSAQWTLQFKKYCLKKLECHLRCWNGTILAILNLHITLSKLQ